MKARNAPRPKSQPMFPEAFSAANSSHSSQEELRGRSPGADRLAQVMAERMAGQHGELLHVVQCSSIHGLNKRYVLLSFYRNAVASRPSSAVRSSSLVTIGSVAPRSHVRWRPARTHATHALHAPAPLPPPAHHVARERHASPRTHSRHEFARPRSGQQQL